MIFARLALERTYGLGSYLYTAAFAPAFVSRLTRRLCLINCLMIDFRSGHEYEPEVFGFRCRWGRLHPATSIPVVDLSTATFQTTFEIVGVCHVDGLCAHNSCAPNGSSLGLHPNRSSPGGLRVRLPFAEYSDYSSVVFTPMCKLNIAKEVVRPGSVG